jgi:DNA-binding MarR family transcriptional regulator
MSEAQRFYKAADYRINDSIGYLVNRLSQVLGREIDRRVAELGLTDAQWKPLLLLQQGVCSTAADISRMIGLDTGALTRLLDRLESKGLIRRVRSLADRRVINLELTAEGQRVANEVPGIIVGLANQFLDGFSEQEYQQFRHYLNRALDNLGQLDCAAALLCRDKTR